MPIVSESQTHGDAFHAFSRSTGATYSAAIPVGSDKSQTGFRSGGLHDQPTAADASRSKTWADTLEVVRGLEYEYNTRVGRRMDHVNERDYSRTDYALTTYQWAVRGTDGGTDTSGNAGLHLQPSVPTWLVSSAGAAASEASGMMRASVPTAPAIDLVRALGELRDFPKSLHPGNYFPTSGGEVGGAYLNQVFGLQPTGRDLASMARVVTDSDAIIRGFVAHEKQRLRRRRSKVLHNVRHHIDCSLNRNSVVDSIPLRDSDAGDFWGSVVSYMSPVAYSSFYPVVPFKISVNVQATSIIRQFATFEYFIPRPTNLVSRLDHYRRKAAVVAGQGLGPATLYDLTPWTWLANWFVDVGGLLRYQETVAANSVVATMSGWVSEARVILNAYLLPSNSYWEENSSHLIAGSGTSCTAIAERYRRRAGGPYDILQPWSLSGGQAAIVTALAIGRPGIL